MYRPFKGGQDVPKHIEKWRQKCFLTAKAPRNKDLPAPVRTDISATNFLPIKPPASDLNHSPKRIEKWRQKNERQKYFLTAKAPRNKALPVPVRTDISAPNFLPTKPPASDLNHSPKRIKKWRQKNERQKYFLTARAPRNKDLPAPVRTDISATNFLPIKPPAPDLNHSPKRIEKWRPKNERQKYFSVGRSIK